MTGGEVIGLVAVVGVNLALLVWVYRRAGRR